MARKTGIIAGLFALTIGASCLVAHGHRRFGLRAATPPCDVGEREGIAAAQKSPPKAGPQPKTDGVEKTILDNAKLFMEAFNRQDVKAVIALCTDDCEFIERDGTTLRGHEEIEREFTEDFKANSAARISLSVDAVRMLTPDVAVEQGKTIHFPDGKTATVETKYEVTHVKKGNRWLMAHGRSYDAEILTPYEYLRDLEWLVGVWVDESPDSVVETSYRWDDNKSFLLQQFTVRVKGQKVISGNQRIGWDPLSKHLKAWVFDSDGGYGESLWSSVDGSWVIKAKGVRADGTIVTATNQLTRTGADRMAYQSVDRIAGDERMPNLAVTVVRQRRNQSVDVSLIGVGLAFQPDFQTIRQPGKADLPGATIMKTLMRMIGVVLALCAIGLLLDATSAWAGRGRGGGGGGGGRGGGVSRPSGGGVSRPGGGGISHAPSVNRSPSFSAPKVSQPSVNRPAGGGNLKAGGPSLGTRDMPGVASGPKLNPGTRPAIDVGKGKGPAQTPKIIEGKGAINPGIAKRPAIDGKIGGGKGPLDPGSANRPGFDAKSGFGKVDPKYGVRPGQQPSLLPGLGLAAGAGAGAILANRDGPGRRQENIQDRKENLGERSQNMHDRLDQRQDFWKQSQEQRQDYLNNRREDWQNWTDDYGSHHNHWHHGYWNGEGWWQHMWEDHTAAMIVGTTMWGVNRMSSWFGTSAYENPYYTEPVPVGDTYIDNSVSLAAPPAENAASPEQPPGVTDPGMKAFADAQAAFYEGRYQEALTATNQALASMPKDAIIHEFRALVLFALGNYREAAGALHPVLAVAPGWDWTTMISLYPDTESYEKQLRKLETYVEEQPKSAQGHFVLGYHYLTGGHTKHAAAELQEVRKLAPQDTVSAQLLELIESKGGPPAEPRGEHLADIDVNQLMGAWTATRGKATFDLTLGKDMGFTWSYREGKTKQEVKGAFAVDGTTLSMEPDAGGVMLAELSVPQGGAFSFRTVGAPKSDPGLAFKRK